MRYTEYVMDRFSTCMSTISRLVDYIQSAMELEDEETEPIDVLQSQVSQLLDCVREYHWSGKLILTRYEWTQVWWANTDFG